MVVGLLERGSARLATMSVYWMIACRVSAVTAFFECCPPALVACTFCDIAFKNYMLEHTRCVRLQPEDSEARHLINKHGWLVYYNHLLDSEEAMGPPPQGRTAAVRNRRDRPGRSNC